MFKKAETAKHQAYVEVQVEKLARYDVIAARVKRLEDEAREALLQYQFLENEKVSVNEQCQQLQKELR